MIKYFRNMYTHICNLSVCHNDTGVFTRLVVIGYQLALMIIMIINIYHYDIGKQMTMEWWMRLLTHIAIGLIFATLALGTIVEGFRVHFFSDETKQKDDLDGPTV